MKLSTLIKKHNFSYVNQNLTDENFPEPKKIEKPTKDNWKLIRPNKIFTSEEALQMIKDEGCRPMNVHEMLLWLEKYKNQLRKPEFVLAFGQMWKDFGGYHWVPGVLARSGGDFEFRLDSFEYDWDDYCCLVCFCDPSLKPNY